jgi:hypothetical protein
MPGEYLRTVLVLLSTLDSFCYSLLQSTSYMGIHTVSSSGDQKAVGPHTDHTQRLSSEISRDVQEIYIECTHLHNLTKLPHKETDSGWVTLDMDEYRDFLNYVGSIPGSAYLEQPNLIGNLQSWTLEHLTCCTTGYYAHCGMKVELRSPSHLPNFVEGQKNLVIVRLPKGGLHAGPARVAGSKDVRTLFCVSGETLCKPNGSSFKDYNERVESTLLHIHDLIVQADSVEDARAKLVLNRESLVKRIDATAKPLGNPKWQPWGGPSHQAFSNRFFGVLITQSTKGEMLGHLWQSHTTIDEYTDIRQLLERRAIVTEALNMMERPVDIPLGFSYTLY